MRTIKYTASYEKLISRLPAMFAYVETDEQGVTTIVKATKGEQGNYGKIVADLVCPYGFDYVCSDDVKLTVTANETHSYRKLIDIYYKAIKDKEWERYAEDTTKDDVTYHRGEYTEPFLAFIERGIGLKYVGLSEEETEDKKCGVSIKNKFPLAPDYIYLGEAHTLYDKMIKMQKQVSLLKDHTETCKEDRFYYLKLKKEFEMMNGENLIAKLAELIEESESVAEEYLGYAVNGIPKLNFNVNLTTTIKDLGMVTPYIQEWIPGKRYYHGDVVYYVDENGYGLAWECNIEDIDADIVYYVKEEEEYKQNHPDEKDKTYVFLDEYNRKYINGQYDEETELIYFENGKQDVHDGKKTRNYWNPQSLSWVDENEYSVGKKYVQGVQKNTLQISGTCNSHLHSLRRYDEYINSYDQSESPYNFKDWLWYYRVGTISNRESVNDEFGNIGVLYGDEEEDKIYIRGVEPINNIDYNNVVFDEEKYAINLALWGDVLTDIVAKNYNDDNTGTITFTYWLGAHLKAEKGSFIIVNDDIKICEKEYKQDEKIDDKKYYPIIKNKNITIKVDNDITIRDEVYKKGDELQIDKFNYLLDDFNNKVLFVVREGFVFDGVTYKKDDIIQKYTYDKLCVHKNKIDVLTNTEFTLNERTYEKYDKIEYDSIVDFFYNNVSFYAKENIILGVFHEDGETISYNDYKKLSKTNKNNVSFIVNEDFVFGGKDFKQNDEIKKSEYFSFNGGAKDNVDFKVTEQFSLNGKTYLVGENFDKTLYNTNFSFVIKKNIDGTNYITNTIISSDEYDKLYFDGKIKVNCYKEGDDISIDVYNTLTEENVKNVLYKVVNDFSYGQKRYEVKQELTFKMYSKISENDKINNIDYYVNEKFSYFIGDAEITYNVGEKIEYDDYKKLGAYYQNFIKYIVNKAITYEEKNCKSGEFISKSTYYIIGKENKQNIEFLAGKSFEDSNINIICERYLIIDGRPYYKGDVIPNTKYYQTKIKFVANCNFNVGGKSFYNGVDINESTYLTLDANQKNKITLYTKTDFFEEPKIYKKGSMITNEIYVNLDEDNKQKCTPNEEWYAENDDGIKKYFFTNPTIDTTSKYGVNKGIKYIETYIYYKSEEKDSIWQLVERCEFDDYVNGKFDKESNGIIDVKQYKTREKFEFDTSNNVYVYDINIGNRIKEVPYIRTNFEANVDITHIDVEKVPLVRYDYYNGVNFQPSVNKDINIERGVTQAYEKFIKFSEIKTFEDLENYANGGFFVFSKEDIDLG